MLPNFQKTKDKLSEFYIEMTVRDQFGLPIESKKIFEGDQSILINENGEVEITEIRQFSSTITISPEEYETLSFPDILEKLNEKAKEMSKDKSKFALDKISEAVEKVGNVVNFKDSLDPKHFFEMIEKIQIDFDEKGEPFFPTFIGGKEACKNFEILLKKIDSVPEYKEQMNELMERKKIQYNDRENNRKLVG